MKKPARNDYVIVSYFTHCFGGYRTEPKRRATSKPLPRSRDISFIDVDSDVFRLRHVADEISRTAAAIQNSVTGARSNMLRDADRLRSLRANEATKH
jgi:hypothetical protein